MSTAIKYRELLDSLEPTLVAEATAPELPDELSLQSLWFAGQFGRDFVTTDGRPVSIVQFGSWNRSAGPDFLNTAVEIAGQIHHGPLELDTRTTDWEAHGHATNVAFDEVVLHVAFQQPGQKYYTYTSKGAEIAQVIVPEARVREALAQPRFSTAPAHIGRCSTPLATMSEPAILRLMDGAARHRMEHKARRLRHSVDAVGLEQTLWQSLARVLGYRPNALAFTLLAQRLQIGPLRQRIRALEAVVFGAAGFLRADLHERAPDESRAYLRELWDNWWIERTEHEPDATRAIQWQMHGIRPVNHPHRRLGALAAIAGDWPAFRRQVLQAKDLKAIIRWLTERQHPFWSHQHTLSSVRSESPIAIFGRTRAIDFATNVVVPLRLDDDPSMWDAFTQLPAQGSNEKVKRALIRLFGKRPGATKFAKKAWQQQALLQIYDDFCLTDATDCERCQFPEQLRDFQ